MWAASRRSINAASFLCFYIRQSYCRSLATAGFISIYKMKVRRMRLSWYDFSFELPDHWETSRYSIAQPTGRFEFLDKNGQLGRVSWEVSKRIPDQQRILAEYHRKYLENHDEGRVSGFTGIKTTRVGSFMVGYRDEGEPCQAVAYLPECKKTILWVFPSYDERLMQSVWKPILESFHPNRGDMREWSAFGVQCRLPKEFEIERVICRPADVWIEFQHTNMHRVDFHRWGLPGELLRNSDMEAFIRRVVTSQEGRVLSAKKTEFQGMPSVDLKTEIRGTKGMDRLFSSYWKGIGRIWHNEKEKRLYACMQAAPNKIRLLSDQELFSS
jgi:hypothetical protein